MFLLHPPVPPWLTPDAAGIELVLLGEQALAAGAVFVRTLPDNEELLTPMQLDGRQGALWRFRTRIAWDGGQDVTRYAFVALGSDGRPHWLAADGQHPHVPPEAQHFRIHRHERPPAWVRDQVFYQVFPDRFARSPTVPLPPAVTLQAWGSPPDPRRASREFYGGNLLGLQEQLPYLSDELGVTALYLNPVFESGSNHRYDTSDYTQVDALLGGNEALQALGQALRARGMRLVLDAVVNHTGAQHPWLTEHPDWYARDAAGAPLGWKGHANLPVLDFAVPAVQQAIYGAPGAVLRRWLRPPYAVDGWRLDVIHMLGEGPGAAHNAKHVRDIRGAMRKENPQAYVLGEHFAEATRWLQGDQEDGAMNYYGFTWPVRGWLAGLEVGGRRHRLDTAAFEAWLTRAMAVIPYDNQLAQLNLLGSHDTPRLLTELSGDHALLQLAMTLLFTRPGVPCIYYGDEIGLAGAADPDCRRCFDWQRGHWPQPLWQHVQRLAHTRQQRTEWRHGATLTLGQGDDWLAFARLGADAATVVLANRGDHEAVIELPLWPLPLNVAAVASLCGPGAALTGDGRLRVRVPGRGSTVLLLN